ncbi:MAG: hypothetical protein ACOX6E_08260 [Syntrophomonadaceae bacterium]
MIFKIRLQTGFFRTQLYYITIAHGQIVLTPQEINLNQKLVISEGDLQSVSIMRRDLLAVGFEIITRNGLYTGSFTEEIELEKLSRVLAEQFGYKFILQN